MTKIIKAIKFTGTNLNDIFKLECVDGIVKFTKDGPCVFLKNDYTEGLTMNHWHSVADGDCPKWLKGDAEDMPFVVISKGGNQLFAYYDEDEDGVCDFYDDCDCPLDVVYWMEIPQLSKEGGAK